MKQRRFDVFDELLREGSAASHHLEGNPRTRYHLVFVLKPVIIICMLGPCYLDVEND